MQLSMSNSDKNAFHQNVVKIIKRIPEGCVVSYGQVAALVGEPRKARHVGWVLHSSSESESLPWFRVINSQGRISLPLNGGYELQKALLEQEGVVFNESGRVDFKKFGWRPG